MPPLVLLGLLSTLVLAIAIAGFLLLTWRKKRKQHDEMERLLDDISARQGSRVHKLKKHLIQKHRLDAQQAENFTQQLIAAEKRFLQQFIDQRLQQQSIEYFYEQLCELLDGYLDIPPTLSDSKNPADGLAHSQTRITESNIDTPAPDWGDVFD